MSRLGVAVNLEKGGTNDLLVVSFPEGYPQGKLEFNIHDTPRKISGIQKVAQMFLKVLLTTKGSDVINNNLGTEFRSLVTNSNRTGIDQLLYNQLISCVEDAEGQSKFILNSNNKDLSSQLDSIIVLGIREFQEGVSLYLKLVTRSGEFASVALPFPQLDLKLTNG